MKKLLLQSLLIISLFITGCSRDDDEPTLEYYVRYTAISRPNESVTMYFKNVDGNNSFVQASMPDGKFQYAVGPVQKGFEATMVVSYDAGGPVYNLSIEVARGAEPFVLKKFGTDYFSLYYTIE